MNARAVFFALLLGLGCASPLSSCGVPKPPPVVPPGGHSCDEACKHVAASGCGTSERVCLELCVPVATHNPAYPTCMFNAAGCDNERACGGSDDSSTPTKNGPGGQRTGP